MLRRIFTFVPLLLLAGSALLLFFVNLAGASDTGVLRKFYWSEADTSAFGSSHATTRWTLYSSCGVTDGKNTDCTSKKPAYPYSPADNFDSDKVPTEFVKHRKTYYYLSRFAYAFFLVGIVFSIIALIPVAMSCFASGFITGILSTIATGIALLFTAAGAAFNTAAHVKGRNAFKSAGYNASLSKVMFGITWAAVLCLLLAFLWMCFVAGKGAANRYSNRHADDTHESYAERKISSTDSSHNDHLMYNNTPAHAQNESYEYNGDIYGSQTNLEPTTQRKFFFRRNEKAAY